MYNKVSDEDAAQINKINKKPQRTKKIHRAGRNSPFSSARVASDSTANESMSQWMDGAAVAYRNTAAIRHLRNQSTTLDSYPGVTQAEKEGGGLTYHHGEFTKLSTATAASRTSAGRPGPCTSRINADDAEAAADCDADDGEDDVDGVSGLKNRRKKQKIRSNCVIEYRWHI